MREKEGEKEGGAVEKKLGGGGGVLRRLFKFLTMCRS